MPEIQSHPPGAFCWAELATSDPDAAKRFYTQLFGWTFEDSPSGPGMIYTMLRKSGKSVGALYGMRPDQKGMPPNWSTYFTVKSADESARQAGDRGAKIVMAPFDVMDVGRMAVVQDPQGAFFSMWEPRKHIGVEIAGEPGTPCWAELETTDTSAAEKFYTAVFPWTSKPGGDYTEFHLNGRGIGGMMRIPPEWGPVPPHWLVYFEVSDADAAATKVKELGGGVRVAPTDVANVGRFAVLHDPQGASFAVVRLDPQLRK